MTKCWDFDVAVVGGGPGGSAAAAALVRRGHSVVQIEKTTFPRFHIGESQLPWLNEVLAEIGATEAVAAAGFVQKWGAAFGSGSSDVERYADFACAPEVPCPQTYQVPRERFDQVLLEHAAACGVTVKQSCQATCATFDPDGVDLTYETADGSEVSLRVGAIVDASGRYGFLARRFGQREADPRLRNIAVHRQYEGVPRREGRRAGDIRILTRADGGWFWLIPISEHVTSVGVVLPQTSYRAVACGRPEDTLDAVAKATPNVAALLAGARAVSEARFEADYSYLHSLQAGDRFVLVGDAGAFLDPIFSTGVLLAMQSGVEAAAAISAGLRDGDLSARRFRAFERQVVKRYRHFRRLVVSFYDPAFRDLFLSPSSRFGLYEAVLSTLAGNWRPSWSIRWRLWLFFLLVRLQRRVALAPRHLEVATATMPGLPRLEPAAADPSRSRVTETGERRS